MNAIVIAGPCYITWNSQSFFSKGDVQVEFARELFDIVIDSHGLVDSRHKSSQIKITFTPSGQGLELAALVMWATGKSPGQSLVPQGAGAEKALIIQPLTNAGGASKIWTFLRAGVTNVSPLQFSATKTMLGPVTFTALCSTVTANTFFTTAAYSAPSSGVLDDFSVNDIATMPCELVWADIPGTLASGDVVINSVDGWTVNVNIASKEHERETMGIADITLKDVTASISGQAANIYDHLGALIAESAWLALMPFMTTYPGQKAIRKKITLRSLINDVSSGSPLTAAGTTFLNIPKAEWTKAAAAWGAEANRSGMVNFKAIPTFTDGVREVLIDVSMWA